MLSMQASQFSNAGYAAPQTADPSQTPIKESATLPAPVTLPPDFIRLTRPRRRQLLYDLELPFFVIATDDE